ncbi:hypothetical protein CV102_14915 [Natronococcus pandeyae]|uniref:Uncharacterized protein n=1 Tax=Natronococcus pandeyae TaxID=2055836 RepID=A0A8J8TQ12_9EURY|nr:hypothetical protein [Natronococcus pandeyae]TYL38003.1 hypothetical protein CV102_14915 [Natronococcus pandeyae]
MIKQLEKEIPEEIEAELLERENVIGVGRGRKRVRGQYTDEEVIIAFVEKKVEEEDLDEDQIVPQSVEIEDQDVDTDVQAAPGGFHALQQQQTVPRSMVEEQAVTAPTRPRLTRRDRWRPAAPGGVSISHPAVSSGTLGTPPLLTQEGERVFLTNAHVAAPMDRAERGDSCLQPGSLFDGRSPGDKIGELLEWSELSADKDNISDSALVKITDDLVRNDILGIGPLKGWTEANYEEKHMKSGATTNVTSGHLIARDFTGLINFRPDKQLRFTGLDVFEPISAGGDSGSIIGITRQDGSFYGTSLLFAGSVQQTLAVPMTAVQEVHGQLGVEQRQQTSDQQEQVEPYYGGQEPLQSRSELTPNLQQGQSFPQQGQSLPQQGSGTQQPPIMEQGIGTSPTMGALPEVQTQGVTALEAPPNVQAQQAATAKTGVAETEFAPQYFYAGGLRRIGASGESWFHIGDFDWRDNFHFTVVPLDQDRSLTFKWVNSYRLNNGQVRYWALIQNHTNQSARFYIRAFQER